MSRQREKARVTHRGAVALARLPRPEQVLLHIAARLEHEANHVQNDTRNVAPRAKVLLRVARNVGRVAERHGQRDDPDPEHLKDPEAKELEKVAAHLVEALVLARLEDAEEEEAGEAHRPHNHEEGDDDLPRVQVAAAAAAAEGEGEDGENGKVEASCEICDDAVSWVWLRGDGTGRGTDR